MIIEKISLLTGKDRDFLMAFARSASIRYKKYEVEKRTGGMRLIEQPARSVKTLQRLVSKLVFSKLPVHDCAKGYIRDVSIRDNAEKHSGFRFSLRVDIKDFFWSFTSREISSFLLEKKDFLNIDDSDVIFLTELVVRDGRLAMGAPSSPTITNAMMYDIDAEIFDLCGLYKVVYTRYADDFFFSSNEKGLLQHLYPKISLIFSKSTRVKLSINEEKTSYLSKKYKRSVTGMILKPDGGISIGRDRKRFIKSGVYKILSQEDNPELRERIKGMLAWAMDVEPSFYESLTRKFGAIELKKLMED